MDDMTAVCLGLASRVQCALLLRQVRNCHERGDLAAGRFNQLKAV